MSAKTLKKVAVEESAEVVESEVIIVDQKDMDNDYEDIEKEWMVHGQTWVPQDKMEKARKPLLNNNIYQINFNNILGLHLLNKGRKFDFGFKIYGLEKDFIAMVKESYKKTSGNFGVMLNGIKGTGKTITGEMIANDLDLPILLIDQDFGNELPKFLADIKQDIIVFVDEYEKVFGGGQPIYMRSNDDDENAPTGSSSLLSVMDGTLKTEFRRVFIFTTNRPRVNENLLSRPSRVRYVKQFGDLQKEQIDEILEDLLLNKEHKNAVIEFCRDLEIVTVDIIKSIIQEVNNFDTPPDISCEFLNVAKKKVVYDIVKLNPRAKESWKKEESLEYNVPKKLVENFIEMASTNWKSATLTYGDVHLRVQEKAEVDSKTYIVTDHYSNTPAKKFTIKLKRSKSYNSVFSDYAF